LPFRVSVWLAGIAFGWCGLMPDLVVADPLTATFAEVPSAADFLRELERRELDRVAMAWCRERLANGKPSPDERFELTLGMARGAARGAMAEFGADRETLWDESRNWLETLRAEVPAARRIEVDLASADLLRLRGDWERRWAELRPFDPSAAKQARNRLVAALDGVGAVIAHLERQPARNEAAADGASRPRALMDRAERLRALVCLDLWELSRSGLAVTPGGPDTATLSREVSTAVAYLAEVAKERRLEGPDRDVLVLLQARFARMRGDAVSFEDIVRRSASSATRVARARLSAERMLLTKSVGDADGVEIEEFALSVPEYEWTRLCLEWDRTRGALRERPQVDRRQREQVLAPLLERIRRFSVTAPRTWALLGQQLDDTVVHLAKYGPTTAPLAERAKSDYLAGQFDDSIKAYLEAAESARKLADRNSAFELTYRAASILVDRMRYDEAARRLSTLVDGHPEHPDAAAADLLACHALGMVAEATPGEDASAAVVARLIAHMQRFPESPRLAEVALRLGRAHGARSEWPEALAAFQKVPSAHASSREALVGLTAAYRSLIEQERSDPEDLGRLADDAQMRLGERLPVESDAWTVEECAAAVLLARLHLVRQPPDANAADDRLNRAENRLATLSTDSPENAKNASALLAEARQLRVVSLAGRGELDAARVTLGRLADAEPGAILELLDGLDRVAPERPETARALAQLQRETALRLADRRDTLSDAQRDRLDRVLARAYALTGDGPSAIRLYRALAASHPREVELKIALADTLANQGGAEQLSEARGVWKGIETLRVAGTVPWCEARLKQCELLARGGDKPAAEKLMKLTRLLHPKLGSPEVLRRFAEFEATLRGP
jgi:tetratricopeptide (TPR) repeat protein